MDIQDLLEFYWAKMQSETNPDEKARWAYYVDRLTLMLIDADTY
jgi:hypothetical protein